MKKTDVPKGRAKSGVITRTGRPRRSPVKKMRETPVEQAKVNSWSPVIIPRGATREERRALGKAARLITPLSAHARLDLSSEGRDLVAILEESNAGRIQELVPLRHGRMLVSPFTFYRGSAALMALDLSRTGVSGLYVQACGDCHIHNFGAYATPERKIVIDINDFDETLPAPWEWDLKRLAASLVIAAVGNGLSLDAGKDAAFRMVHSYREFMSELSEMTHLEVWYSHVEAKRLLEIGKSEARLRRQRLLDEALKKSSPEVMLEKFVATSGGKLRFKDLPPLLTHMEGITAGETEKQVFESYSRSLRDHRQVLLSKYEVVDIARKVVGIGSVGTVCGVILLASSDDDVLVLQLKEARPSVLEPYAGKSMYEHAGERVVNGQKLMQAASDNFLGWTTGLRPPYREFYIRQLRDVKIGTNTVFWDKDDFKLMSPLAGQILARAHARSGDASFVRGYLGKTDEFDEAVADYAGEYARQTERDYKQFVKACKQGVLKAQSVDE